MEINRMLLPFTAHPHGKQKHNCVPSQAQYRERRQAHGIAATSLVALDIPPFCTEDCCLFVFARFRPEFRSFQSEYVDKKDECSAFMKR